MSYIPSIGLTVWLVILATGTVNAQNSLPAISEIELELEKTRGAIRALEFRGDRLDRSLLEPLDQFGQQLMNAGENDEADAVLDQAVQITRVSEGLYSINQFPILLRRIENYAYQGDWESARESIEHFSWILTRGANEINDELLASILSVVDIHLWGIASDQIQLQDYHFRNARRMNNIAIRAATRAWSENDRRLPALHYKLVIQLYLQATAVEVGAPSGISLRRYSETGLALTKKQARQSYFYTGLGLLTRNLNVYANQPSPDLEGMALTHSYIGDWNVMFGNAADAAAAYSRSNALLLEAGIEEQQINQFFAKPRLLPALDFVDNWSSAMAGLDKPPDTGLEGAGSPVFNFQQWSLTYPHHLAPVALGTEPITSPAEDYAQYSFSLAGLEDNVHKYQGKTKKAVSSPQNLELLSQNFNEPIDRMELENAIMDFHFRPRLVNGIPQSVNATIIYQLANQ